MRYLLSLLFIILLPCFLIKAEEVAQCPYSTSETQTADKSEEKKESSDENKDKEPSDEEKNKGEEPLPIGNLSLPTSQQPAALFGFGGNIIDKGEIQLYLFGDGFFGKNRIITDIIPNVTFGITDNLSVQFNFPFTPIMKDDHHFSHGLEDWFIQFEYAFYNKKRPFYTDQATVLWNITVPTGSIKKVPNTGVGSPSFFIGGTYYHTRIDWFVFVAEGAILTTSDHRTKYGNQFLYQFGVGRNIPSPPGWIYAWMIEVDGQYGQRNRIFGEIDHNSGGNIVFVTPSLWFSNRYFLIQFGPSFPINQNWFGIQGKFDWGFNFNMAWSFYPDS